jgi:cytochrome oxidase assembly protein ShyY1
VTDRYDLSTLMQPRWILAAAVGLGFAILFLFLGLWQLERLDERQTRNAAIIARSDEPVRPLVGLIADHDGNEERLPHRRTTVVGTYRADEEFLSIGRVYGDVVGTLVVTPLDLEDGSVLMVVRGIAPSGIAGPPAIGYEVPRGPVTLEGLIGEGEAPLRIGEADPPSGTIESISRIDLAYIDAWIEGDVLPFTLLLDTQSPLSAAEPTRIPPEELSDGSHLGYAIQWFAFAVIAVVGVVALLRRAARNEPTPAASEGPDPLV